MNTADPSIYNYQSARLFVIDTLAERQVKNPGYSLRKFARDLKLKSHTLLNLIIKGKRPMKIKHAEFLAQGLELEPQERLYLQALIQYEFSDDINEKMLFQTLLNDMNPQQSFRSRTIDSFEAISHWKYTAVLEVTKLSAEGATIHTIENKLKNLIPRSEIRTAVEKLHSLELLQLNDGGLYKSTSVALTSANDVYSAGVQRYHISTLELAQKRISDLPLDKREFQSVSLPVPSHKVPEAKRLIRQFRSRFENEIGDHELESEVYQLSVQFYQLTESPGASLATENEGVATNTQLNKGVRS